MKNRLSYCGLVDAKIRASDKDLPVLVVPVILVVPAIVVMVVEENNSYKIIVHTMNHNSILDFFYPNQIKDFIDVNHFAGIQYFTK